MSTTPNVSLREIGECYDDAGCQLRLTLRQSRVGTWELELLDIPTGRELRRQYDDEHAARTDVELAYAYGRQYGRWKIQRAVGYLPDLRWPASAVGFESELGAVRHSI